MLPHLWISDRHGESSSQWLRLDWDARMRFREMRLYFNPDLCRELTNTRGESWSPHHGLRVRQGMPPELVRDYTIRYRAGSEWMDLADN